MTEDAPRITFFSLPTELRLQIAAYALEQLSNAGLIEGETPIPDSQQTRNVKSFRTLRLDTSYTAAANLSILLVCRQFWHDFTRLAIQKTTFLLTERSAQVVANQSEHLLRNIRKLALQCSYLFILSWEKWPFNDECMKLDELSIANDDWPSGWSIARPLRRLQNVKTVKFILLQDMNIWRHRLVYHELVGELIADITEVDCAAYPVACCWSSQYRCLHKHTCRRYASSTHHNEGHHAPTTPNVESTWWDWSYDKEEHSFTLVAQDLEEEDYKSFMKPKVDKVMNENIERWLERSPPWISDDESDERD